MKILHTSDWHLGKIIYEKSLLEDQKFALKQILESLRKIDYDILIISGDIYDRSLPPADATSLLSWFLTEMRKFCDTPAAIIPGNHDNAIRLGYLSELMTISNIHIRTSPDDVDKPLSISDTSGNVTDFYMTPFLHPSTYNIESPSHQKNRYEIEVEEAVRRIKKKINTDHINVFIGHLYTLGGNTTDSERPFVGASGEIRSEIFEDFDYVALGHLHKPQKISKKIYYPGSLLKYSFSEANDKKQIISVTLTHEKLKIDEIPIKPLRDMVKIKADFSHLLNSTDFLKYKDCYLEIELCDAQLVHNPMNLLRSRFPNTLSIKQPKFKPVSGGFQYNINEEKRNIFQDYRLFENYLYNDEKNPEKHELFCKVYREGSGQ